MYRSLVGAACVVIVIAGLKAAAGIVVPFLFALFLAIVLQPLLEWLQRRGISTLVAAMLVATAILLVGAVLFIAIGGALSGFMDSLPMYRERVRDSIYSVVKWLNAKGIPVEQPPPGKMVDSDHIVNGIGLLVSGLGEAFAHGLFILFTVLFMLMETPTFANKLRSLPGCRRGEALAHATEIVDNVRRYMVIKVWISLINGGLVFLGLLVLGVQYAALWGVLTFATNFIPNIGTILAAIPAVGIAWLQLGWTGLVWSTVIFLIVELLSGYILEPRWTGQGLGISTLVAFVSLVFWGWVLGPAGMLLSVPLTMSVKIALQSTEQTRWAATLLGEIPPEQSESESV